MAFFCRKIAKIAQSRPLWSLATEGYAPIPPSVLRLASTVCSAHRLRDICRIKKQQQTFGSRLLRNILVVHLALGIY